MNTVNSLKYLVLILMLCSQISFAQVKVKTNMGHSADIYDIDLSADDNYLLTAAKDNVVRLWEVKTGREIYAFVGHTNLITTVALSQDMKFAASGGSDNKIIVWDLTKGALFKSIPWNAKIGKVKIDAARNLLYAADDKGYFMAFTLNTGELKHSFQAHTAAISDFDKHTKANLLITSAGDGYVKSWSLDTYQAIKTIYTKSSTSYQLAIAPTGDKVILAEHDSPTDDGSAILFIIDLNGNVLKNDFAGYTRIKAVNSYYSINDVRSSGSKFITAGRDGKIKVWDENNSIQPITYTTEPAPRSVALAKDANYYFGTANGRVVGMWNTNSGEVVRIFASKGLFINDLALSPNQQTLVLAGARAYSFDLNTCKLVQTVNWHTSENDRLNNNIRPISCVTFSPDGKYMATGAGGYYGQVAEPSIKIVNTKDGSLFKTIDAYKDGLTSIAFPKDGSKILMVGGKAIFSFNTSPISSVAKAFNVASGNQPFTFSGNGNWARDIAVDATSGNIAIASSTKELYLYAPDGTLLRNIMADQELSKLVFFQKGSLLVAGGIKGDLMIYEAKTGILQKKIAIADDEISSLAVSSKYIATGGFNGNIKIWHAPYQSPLVSLYAHKNKITGLAFNHEGKQLISCSADGMAKFWDVALGTEQVTLIPMTSGEGWVAYTPDGYYFGTKNAIGSMVHYVDGLKTIGFDQFDLKYNRPDMVLKKMGGASPQTISAYKSAWEKRVRKMGFDPLVIESGSNFNAPTIQLTTAIPAFHTVNEQKFTFSMSASDPFYSLNRLLVSVNGVPLYGLKGQKLDAVQNATQEIAVLLNEGKNIIKVSVMNSKGAESLAEQFEITYKPATTIGPNLYVIAIGVSKFAQSDFNLTYADKDANDLVALLKSAKGYGQVVTHCFTNEQATVENILALRSELEKTKVDDEVVVFVASHGLLDNDLDYYIAMHNTQFENPKNGGLRYDVLENLLDDIPARNKLMLIDACHSGEVDKEELTLIAENTNTTNGEIKSRGFKTIETQSAGIGLQSSFELMKELFADLRRNNGAVVISSASGKEYAFESAQWQNGVFTYSLLEGLKSGNADANKDKTISVAEIRDYVGKRVVELTNGKQNPTSRTENLESDFRVW